MQKNLLERKQVFKVNYSCVTHKEYHKTHKESAKEIH